MVGDAIELDPYPSGTVDDGFADRWCAALSHCMSRFEGCRAKYAQVRSGGAGAFTADNFPIFDRMRPNVYVAADSNHGYKMIAVGREIARELAAGTPRCCSRFASSASRPASCTRSRTARTRGAERQSREPRGRRRRRARPLRRLAARRARRRRARAREGQGGLRRLGRRRRASCATSTARPRSPTWSATRSRSSRPSRRSSASARSATWRRSRRPRSRIWSRSASTTSGSGYESELVDRRRALPRVPGLDLAGLGGEVEALLHERRGGWADAMRTVRHLADRARAAGARIAEGVEVTGFELGPDGVEAVLTAARPGAVRGRRARPGAVGGAHVGAARAASGGRGRDRRRHRAPAAGLLSEGPGGRVSAHRGRRPGRRPPRSRAARRPSRPVRAAALRPRRRRARARAVGDLLPDRAARAPRSPAAACRW